MTALALGIRENLTQFSHQLVQVLLVGFAIGMTRTVIPALAESEFGVAQGSFLLLTAFVVAFGVVKAVMNFVAGRLSERIGRKQVLLWGWVIALPIPVMIWAAPNWSWIVAATVLLGINQGLCWSMTQTAKLDITRADQRGLTMGLNEFSGYLGVALAGVITAYVAEALGARLGLLIFGMVVIITALVLTVVWVKDTLPWAQAETAAHKLTAPKFLPRYPQSMAEHPSTREVFALMSWRDKRLAALSQAGLVEKSVDALVWVILPVFLVSPRGQPDGDGLDRRRLWLCLGRIATVSPDACQIMWGGFWPNVLGMWICGAGVAMIPFGDGALWWSLWAGFGRLRHGTPLYPNLGASVADITPPAWRGSAIGIYRFWRDLGYGIGALGLGLAAHLSGALDAAFWFVALSMFASGALLFFWGEETHPRLNPASREGALT